MKTTFLSSTSTLASLSFAMTMAIAGSTHLHAQMGIGTNAPTGQLHVDADGAATTGNAALDHAFVVDKTTGAVGLGTSSPVTTLDVIGSFRAGAANRTPATIGVHSAAWGTNSLASGNYSAAWGNGTVANHGSAAWGYNNQANGTGATAFGINNLASASYSLALGTGNESIGGNSIVGGTASKSGGNGISIGHGVVAARSNASHFGAWNVITSGNIFSVGGGSSDTARLDLMALNGSGGLTLAGTLTENSDRRLKKSIKRTTGNLDRILQIEPVTYEWIASDREPGKHVGFIAQNVQTVLPEAIRVGEDDMGILSVADRPILSASVGAIHELNQKLVNAEARIAELEAVNKDLLAIKAAMLLIQNQLKTIAVQKASLR